VWVLASLGPENKDPTLHQRSQVYDRPYALNNTRNKNTDPYLVNGMPKNSSHTHKSCAKK
jgi:hypothetical protein